MPDSKPTFQQVIDDASDTRQKLAALEHQLQQEIDDIDFDAFKSNSGVLTPARAALRKERRATQAEVREGFKVLGFVTAQRLDDAAETGQLLSEMQSINAALSGDLDDLKGIVTYATIAAEAADALAKIAIQLASIAA